MTERLSLRGLAAFEFSKRESLSRQMSVFLGIWQEWWRKALYHGWLCMSLWPSLFHHLRVLPVTPPPCRTGPFLPFSSQEQMPPFSCATQSSAVSFFQFKAPVHLQVLEFSLEREYHSIYPIKLCLSWPARKLRFPPWHCTYAQSQAYITLLDCQQLEFLVNWGNGVSPIL